MKTFTLAEALNNAYGATTQANNLFAKAINSITWDDSFEADGEMYYCKGDLTLTVENINPFEEAYKPTIMVDTCCMELGWL